MFSNEPPLAAHLDKNDTQIVSGVNKFFRYNAGCALGFYRATRMFYSMKPFLLRWLVTTFAVFVAAPIAGIQYDSVGCLLGASLLLGIINAFVRPVLLLLSLPLILVTLGVFILVINALMLKLVGGIVPCFHVPPGFWSPFFGAIVISIVSWLLSAFFRGSDGRVHVITHHARVKQDEIKQARGRVIE